MQNTVIHFTLPKGLALKDGRTLQTCWTYDLVSGLSPYYASVDQVKLAGGQWLRKLQNLTIASQIYQSSQEADLITPMGVIHAETPHGKRVIGSRVQWVTAAAARDLLLGMMSLGPATHVLANFSVTRERTPEQEGLSARLKELNDSLKLYEPTIRSLGRTMPGGRPHTAFAAKGVFDWTEKTPARQWTTTGMGANATTWDFGSPTGGRGKPQKFFSSPFYSPPLFNLRSGVFQATNPLLMREGYRTWV